MKTQVKKLAKNRKSEEIKPYVRFEFPEGNEFWKLRSKHGRDKLFATPELMWDAACEYFQWCIDNPLIEVDFRGKNNEKIELPKMRAFTEIGLCHYLDCNTLYFNQFEKSLIGKDDDFNRDFSKVCSRVRNIIRDQKFIGAAAGFLNANIIARELGLTEKQEIDISSIPLTIELLRVDRKLSDVSESEQEIKDRENL